MSEQYKLSKGRTLTIMQSEYQDENPRDWDNLGTMMCWHRHYNLGDNDDTGAEWDSYAESETAYFLPILGGFNEDYNWSEDELHREAERCTKKAKRDFIILPLYLYDHSGVTMSTGPFPCRWDSGQVGWTYVSKKRAAGEMGIKRWTKKQIDRVEKALRSEVEVYDYYLTGDVYGFEITDKEGSETDSCYGFYGDNFWDNGLLTQVLDWDEAKKIAQEIGGQTAKSASKARQRKARKGN